MIGKLTLKQRKFWKHYLEHNNLSAAAKHAGCQCNTLQNYSTQGRALLNSLELSMPELLDAEGLTDQAMAEPLQKGIKAQKPIVATWEGKITDKLWIEDHPTQLKAVELIGKMKGHFIDKLELTGRDGGDLILQLAPSKSKKDKKKSISFD